MSGISAIRSQTIESFLPQPSEWLLDCSFVEENAGALALGTLEAEETVRINTHVSWCPSCARLVHESRKTVGYLPFLSAASAPSPAAKTNLFERIQREQAMSPIPPGSLDLAGSSSMLFDPSRLADVSLTPVDMAPAKERADKRRFSWEIFAAPLAAVPLVVALAIVGGWALRTQGQLDDRATQAQVLQSQNAELTEQLDFLSNSLDTASTRRFDFESADASLGGNVGGNVVAMTNEAWANLSVWNLPTSSRTYKVLIETKDGQLQQVGQFDVDQAGGAQIKLDLAVPLDQYDSVHVQPVRLSDQSTTNDTTGDRDVLWMDLNSNLGADGGTEANALAN